MTHPKVRFLRPNMVFEGQKSFQGAPPKIKKIVFSKNPNSVICPNMGGGQGSGPRHPDGVRPLGVIR